MTTLELNSLRTRVEGLQKQLADGDAARDRLCQLVKEQELALMDAEGKGDSLEAQWIRAWLASDHKECDRILALRYPQSSAPRVFVAEWGEPVTPLLRLVPAPTPFDAEAAADAAAVMEFGSPAMAHDLGCVMGDDSGDDEQRSARGG